LVEQKHKGWDFAAAQSISCEQNPSTGVERECCFIVCGYYTRSCRKFSIQVLFQQTSYISFSNEIKEVSMSWTGGSD